MPRPVDTTKPTRRGRPATGTLELRKGGWHVRLTVVVDGESVRKWFPLETHDKSVAKRKAARMAKQAAEGTLNVHALASEGKRVETYAEAAARIRARRRLEGRKSIDDEERNDRNYLNPIFGELPITAIKPAHIREALEAARDKGKSQKTLVNIRSSAGVIFDELWRAELIPENPVKRAPFVRAAIDRRERAVLTDEELALYLAWRHPDPRFDVFVQQRQIMSLVSRLFGGARTGDLHALTWQSFDLEGFTCGWVPRNKTERPQRMHIEPVLRPYLRAWWERMGKPAEGLVFPRLIGDGAGEAGKPGSGYAEELRRDLKRAMGLEVYDPQASAGRSNKAGCQGGWRVAVEPERYTPRQRELFLQTEYTRPVDFHSWRRAFNQALADAGVNAQQAAALAGHASLEAHAKYLRNTAKAATLPDAAVPKLADYRPRSRTKISESAGNHLGKRVEAPGVESDGRDLGEKQGITGRKITGVLGAPDDVIVSEPTLDAVVQGDTPAPGQYSDGIPKALPAGRATLVDVLKAADQAVLEGDAHRARRLLAEAIARCSGGVDGHGTAAKGRRDGGQEG